MIEYFERIGNYPLFHFKLSPEYLKKISADVEKSVEDQHDVSQTLVGSIYNGCEVRLNTDYDIFKNIGFKFLESVDARSNSDIDLYVSEAWTVVQKENDYNPLHVHSSFLSGILYIKIPEFIGLPKDTRNKTCKKNEDGFIVFLNNYGFTTFKPVEGEGFIFASNVPHMVYPFSQPGTRISVSWNLEPITNGQINYK